VSQLYEQAAPIKDKRGKRESHPKGTDFAIFGPKASAHRNPCSETDWSGIARAPGLVGVGQNTEGQCRDKAQLDKRPHQIAEFNSVRCPDDELEVAREAGRVDDHQNAKETEILEYLAPVDPKVSPDIFPVAYSQAGSEDRYRRDAENRKPEFERRIGSRDICVPAPPDRA
jgi:hypothetical protein